MKTSLLQLNLKGTLDTATSDDTSDDEWGETGSGCSDSCDPKMCKGLSACKDCPHCMEERSETVAGPEGAVAGVSEAHACASFCTLETCDHETCSGCATCADDLEDESSEALLEAPGTEY